MKPVSGSVVLGMMGVAMVWLFPGPVPSYRPTFFGNGYPVIETLLNADAYGSDEQGTYQGMIVGDDLRLAPLARDALPLTIIADLMRTDLPTVTLDEALDVVLDRLNRYDVLSLVVIDSERKVLGTVTRSMVMRAYESFVQKHR